MTNPVRIVRASIWRTLQERGIIQEESRATHERVRDTAVPDAFEFRGIPLTWPFGTEQDILKGLRLERLNNALTANNNKPIPERLATMKTCRLAYTALWHMTQRDEYDPTPIPAKPVVEHVTPVRVRLNKRKLAELETLLKDLE